ncbi:hypothetical protein ACMZ6Z_08325 [Streptococcus pluranimalium]|uniref:hypothetical protein n=1 Tax=Streptococcus pluranimalium TaxID=82348 RepID=UPI0039FD0D33
MEKVYRRLQMLQVILVSCLGIVSIAVVVAIAKHHWWATIRGLIAAVTMIVVYIMNQQSLKELKYQITDRQCLETMMKENDYD